MTIYPGGKNSETEDDFLTSSGRVNLEAIKDQLNESLQAANTYHTRLSVAFDWWNSRWEGQTIDGRRHWRSPGQDMVFPWDGASDARLRLTKRIINEKKTLQLYALLNMKLQAQSTRPEVMGQVAGQATTLLNWQIFSHMLSEWFTESELAVSYAAGTGASVISVDWEQERRLDRINLSTEQFGLWLSQITGQQFNAPDLEELLETPSEEPGLIAVIQEMSELLGKSDAQKILRDLRNPDKGAAVIPVPYFYRNKPRIQALCPLIDIFFPAETDDFQRAPWTDRVEYVTEDVLYDRQETQDYNKTFVKEACKFKGVYSTGFGWKDWLYRGFDAFGIGPRIIGPGGLPRGARDKASRQNKLIELHHFYHYGLDYGVPCLYRTIFHNDLDEVGHHATSEYQHGQMPFHVIRNETDIRPILSSQGVPETTYTWEQEAKAQVDARTDRASLAMAPPMIAMHGETAKMKRAYVPHGIISALPGRKPEFAQIPPYDKGSVEVTLDIERRAEIHYGWFGANVDPQLKQLRQMEEGDRILLAFKPIVAQIGDLDAQYLPDEIWQRVTGLPPRPGLRDRHEIEGRFEITMTVDFRELDMEFLEKKAKAIGSILPLDAAGVVDRTVLLRELFQGFSYTLADMAIRDPQAVTAKEITDETEKVSLIIASGIEQAMPPEGSNFNVRLQTLQTTLQSNPTIKEKVAGDQSVLKALENRYLYLTRQIQQQKNAQIGKAQVGQAFDKLSPPMIAEPTGGGGGGGGGGY